MQKRKINLQKNEKDQDRKEQLQKNKEILLKDYLNQKRLQDIKIL